MTKSELAALFTAGELAPGEAESLIEAAALLAYAVPQVDPPPSLRDRVMACVEPTPAEPLPGVHVLRAGEGKWRSTPYPGVTYKLLDYDKRRSMATSLLKLEPGAVYPPHRHSEAEQCLVIEGEARIGGVTIRQGDYERADEDTRHGAIETSTGCLLLIIASTHDEMLA